MSQSDTRSPLGQASAALQLLLRLSRRGDLPAEAAALLERIDERIAAAHSEPLSVPPAPPAALPRTTLAKTALASLLAPAAGTANGDASSAALAKADPADTAAGESDATALSLDRRRDRRASDSHTQRRLALLRHLIERDGEELVPTLDPQASLGHSAPPEVDALLASEGRETLTALEDLADLGLLARELHNIVLACPTCRRVQINFREQCPRCQRLELRIEPLLHHFHCAYTGLESEFAHGIELVCPKCRRMLAQRGQDYDRPHDTYVCTACSALFEEPLVDAQCFSCGTSRAPAELAQVRIHRFRPTQLAWRALDQGRLTGLDVTEVLYDARVPLLTRGIYILIFRRELLRLKRHAQCFVSATLCFMRGSEEYPIFREWDLTSLLQLVRLICSSLRQLDVVARLDGTRLGILLVGADGKGAELVRARLESRLQTLRLLSREGHALLPRWSQLTWSSEEMDEQRLLQQIGEVPA